MNLVDLVHTPLQFNSYSERQMIKFYFGHPSDISVSICGDINLKDFSTVNTFGSSFYPSFQKYEKALTHCVISDSKECTIQNTLASVNKYVADKVVTFIDINLDMNRQIYKDAKWLSDFMYVEDRRELSEKIALVKSDQAFKKRIILEQFKIFKHE